MFRLARHISRKGQVIYRQGSGRPSWRDVVPDATALRIGTKLAGAIYKTLNKAIQTLRQLFIAEVTIF